MVSDHVICLFGLMFDSTATFCNETADMQLLYYRKITKQWDWDIMLPFLSLSLRQIEKKNIQHTWYKSQIS